MENLNKDNHFKKWHSKLNKPDNLFTSDIDEEYVEKIMALDVNKEWKILLLMGIGVFTTFSDIKYLDIRIDIMLKYVRIRTS